MVKSNAVASRHPGSGPRWAEWAALTVPVAVYLLVALRHLDTLPLVHQDEPWLASGGWNLATEGRLATPPFAGFNDMGEQVYAWPPVHGIALALVYSVTGLGLVPTRLVPVMATLGVLLLVYGLGRRLAGPGVGLLAVLLLLSTRLLWEGPVTTTGIPLLDIARIGRYDPLVALFGLAAVHTYLTGRDRVDGRGWFAATGLLAALSTLSNAYGAAFLIALVVLSVVDGVWRRALAWMSLGVAGPLVAYTAYALQNPAAWRDQIAVALRGDVSPLEPVSYLRNLIAERHRYAPGLGPVGAGWLLRPGFWAAAVAVPVSLAVLLLRAFRGDRFARTLAVIALVVPGLVAVGLARKTIFYTAATVPLLALAVAMASSLAWQRSGRWAWLTRVGLILVLAATTVEGITRLVHQEQVAARTTPYAVVAQQLAGTVPLGARVLGSTTWWFELADRDYRVWFVPLGWANEARAAGRPVRDAVTDALDRLEPDVILVDEPMRTFFAENPEHAAGLRAWLDAHAFRIAATVDDRSYGRIEVLRAGAM